MAGRGESEELLAAVTIVFATLVLLYAIVQLLDHANVGDATKHFRVIAAVIAPALALYLVSQAAKDAALAPWAPASSNTGSPEPQQGSFPNLITTLGDVLPITIASVVIITWSIVVIRARRRERRGPSPPRSRA